MQKRGALDTTLKLISSNSWLYFTSSCFLCGETDSLSESASLPFFRCSEDGRDIVESEVEGLSEVILSVFMWYTLRSEARFGNGDRSETILWRGERSEFVFCRGWWFSKLWEKDRSPILSFIGSIYALLDWVTEGGGGGAEGGVAEITEAEESLILPVLWGLLGARLERCDPRFA